MSESRDEDLVRRYLEGDVSAFGVLVERHERRVYNLALRMTGREEDARDATQDAFLAALRKLRTFRGEAAFTTWLHRVTVNACYDLLRKRQRQPLLHERSEDDGPRRAEPESPDHADATDLSIDVQRALLRVPQDFRAVLILHDAQDLPYDEVAAIVGVPVGTVKSRLHRGRVALGRALGAREGETSGSSPGPTQAAADVDEPERERGHGSEPSDGTMSR
jgi:RNA polymerase sigma-70 factor (ECF subfamily)